MAKYAVMVSKTVNAYVKVEADDEFEARCIVMDMDGAEIEGAVDWNGDDYIEVTDGVYELEQDED